MADAKQVYERTDDFGTRVTARILGTAVMITTQDHISPPNHIIVNIIDLEEILETCKFREAKNG